MAYNYHRVCLLHLFAYSLLLGGRPAACLRADGDRPASVTFHVAERGKDSWSGNIPAPNADGTDGPFATPSRARDAARLLRATDRAGSLRRGDVVIFVHAGRYELAEPLVFAPEDSGTAESRTVFAAAPEDQGRVVVSGGRAVAGWKAAPGPHGEWVADLPGLKDGWRFCYVSVDGQWRGRPRLPDGETATYTMAGLAGADPKAPYDTPADRFEYARDQIDPHWTELRDVEVVVVHFWVDSHFKIAGIEPDRRVVKLDRMSHASSRTSISRFLADTTSRMCTRPSGLARSTRTHHPARCTTCRATVSRRIARFSSRRDSRALSSSGESRARAGSSSTLPCGV